MPLSAFIRMWYGNHQLLPRKHLPRSIFGDVVAVGGCLPGRGPGPLGDQLVSFLTADLVAKRNSEGRSCLAHGVRNGALDVGKGLGACGVRVKTACFSLVSPRRQPGLQYQTWPTPTLATKQGRETAKHQWVSRATHARPNPRRSRSVEVGART